MSNYYDTLGGDLANMWGYPNMGPSGTPYGPPPNPMTPAVTGVPRPIPVDPRTAAPPPYGGPGVPPLTRPTGYQPPGVNPATPLQPQGDPTQVVQPGPGQPGPGQTGGMPPGGGPMDISSGVPIGPSTDYKSALGLQPSTSDTIEDVIQGLGKGLTAGAGTKNSGLGAFARGMGGAITGAGAAREQQLKNAMAMRTQQFNEVSQTFKNWLNSKHTDAMDQYYENRGNAAITNAQQRGQNSKWWSSPYGLMHQADADAQKQYDSSRKAVLDEAKTRNAAGAAWTSDELDKRLNALPDLDSIRRDNYKKYGLNDDQILNGKALGGYLDTPSKNLRNGDWYVGDDGKPTQFSSGAKTPDSVRRIIPFPGDTMNMDDFHTNVPLGGFYTYKGQLYRRTRPPPGVQMQPQPQNPNIQAGQPNMVDMQNEGQLQQELNS